MSEKSNNEQHMSIMGTITKYLIFTQVALLVLQLTGLITLSWWAVFVPFYLIIGLWTVLWVVLFFAILWAFKKASER